MRAMRSMPGTRRNSAIVSALSLPLFGLTITSHASVALRIRENAVDVRRAAARLARHAPSGQGDEQRDHEERAPVPAQLGPQTEADRAHEPRATRARTCSSTTCPTTDPVTPRPRTCRSTRRDNSPREPSGRQWCYPNAGSGGHPLTSNCQFGLITSWSTRVSLSHWAYWVASHWSAVRWSRKTSMLPMAHMVSALRS